MVYQAIGVPQLLLELPHVITAELQLILIGFGGLIQSLLPHLLHLFQFFLIACLHGLRKVGAYRIFDLNSFGEESRQDSFKSIPNNIGVIIYD